MKTLNKLNNVYNFLQEKHLKFENYLISKNFTFDNQKSNGIKRYCINLISGKSDERNRHPIYSVRCKLQYAKGN